MLVVISDIHFQDTANDAILDENNNEINVDRNVSEAAFKKTFDEIFSAALDNKANELLIVLAGDIFDIHRSQKWLETDHRPYGEDPPDKWGPTAIKILEGIINSNKKAFDIITEELFNKPHGNLKKIEIHYIPGNHDRIINLYLPLQNKVRKLFGIPPYPSGADSPSFNHYYSSNDYGVLIFHGHEYDSANFAGTIPNGGIRSIDAKYYDLATLGDYVTIDVAAAFAYEFRKLYLNKIRSEQVYQALYRKLLEFDDLRPQTDLWDFLEAEMPHGQDFWKYISPVFKEIINKAVKNNFFRTKSGFLGNVLRFFPIQIVPHKLLFKIMFNVKSGGKHPCEHALDDHFLSERTSRHVVAGHTHCPTVEFLKKREDEKELFFFDTGTWRQQIRKCVDKITFSRAKALTYVTFYKKDEDPVHKTGKEDYSFDYWSGFMKKELV